MDEKKTEVVDPRKPAGTKPGLIRETIERPMTGDEQVAANPGKNNPKR